MVTITRPTTDFNEPAHRYLTGLEELLRYYRERSLVGEDITEAEVHFAASLARYRFSPPPETLVNDRFHVMVFGGAGAGKSTVANILAGDDVAEVNAQAGFTKHPIALYGGDFGSPDEAWPTHLGLLERYDGTESSSTNKDHFGYRRVPGDPVASTFLHQWVAWDCPDLTAKDSDRYQPRLVEIAALTDVAIYVASDERYNDELPTRFLQMLLDAGKPVVVALTKSAPMDVEELTRLFQQQVVSSLRGAERIVAVVPVPSPPPGRYHELWTSSYPHTGELREAVESAVSNKLAESRRQERLRTAEYLSMLHARLLAPLNRDIEQWNTWQDLVRKDAAIVIDRYAREYLAGVEYQQLVDAQERVTSSFALGGAAEILDRVLESLRTPGRLVKKYAEWLIQHKPIELPDEDRILDKLRKEMLQNLTVECAARREEHTLWTQLHESLRTEAVALVEPPYLLTRAQHRQKFDELLVRITHEIVEILEARATLLVALRVVRAVADIVAVGLVIYWVGLSPWLFLLIPLSIWALEEIFLSLCRQFVQRRRQQLVDHQRSQAEELLNKAYVEPLGNLPGATGPQLRSLSRLARELPRDLADLAEASRTPVGQDSGAGHDDSDR
ncbi:hypothetical protein Pan216_47400 [Planctomycetes bacterium Pan216]|uniref:G domain-containing protein n=1 Tax=Kolteria novifilia TaxID=2527975 RepID=A0A518BA62_9BACT|nr:hypothetical protein Pan216_47400 [Planctomycetes bacterium Pan216]